ncbi:50S ribosomal protein L11 methyltransferase [Thermoactinomyces sp. Gus2-1]|uniref:50S ribosomal protein L11 methyltransferase n=1 Tax=Thermoactinomyces sp. Gus2-1 TaxID=1535750 RepID=UPI0005015850|nr:50S ribosomal protein L11 methyltransferase [Thermoactinomyces sp. Gus2-1]KFZ40796.1 hypothetical protein JS81_05105 [Thermoactinomyces sp. Gus2-1]
MDWLEVSVRTSHESAEAISEFLQEMGADGVAIEDSNVLHQDFEKRYGEIIELTPEDYPEEGVVIKAYLSDLQSVDPEILKKRIKEKLESLKQYGLSPGQGLVGIRSVSEQSWENEWKTYYKPVRVTDTITIKPVWEDYQPESPDEKIVRLDPGMAFGTGTHPTTKLCIQCLEKHLPRDAKVIDVGCGSGILSIVSAMLGAKNVLALDYDPLAVEKAKENIGLNPIESGIRVEKGDLLKGVSQTADVVVGNLLAELILPMVPDLPRVLVPGGIFIGSGIIEEKADAVEQSLVSCGLQVLEKIHMDGWVAIVAKKW